MNEKRIPFVRTITSKSSMTAELKHFHNNDNENITRYVGKVVISIVESPSNLYEHIYLDKSYAKLLLHSIINHSFLKIFGSEKSFYSGNIQPDKVTSKIFTIGYQDERRKLYSFSITSGLGEKMNNNSIKMTQKDKTVRIYLSEVDAIQFALELYDLIHLLENEQSFDNFNKTSEQETLVDFLQTQHSQINVLNIALDIYKNSLKNLDLKDKNEKEIDNIISIGEKISEITQALKTIKNYT